jgi:hypothetical protein
MPNRYANKVSALILKRFECSFTKAKTFDWSIFPLSTENIPYHHGLLVADY